MGAGTAACTLAPCPPVPRVISTRAGMSLLRDLDAFYLEHRRYSELDSGVESERVWMKCSCGAVLGSNEAEKGNT